MAPADGGLTVPGTITITVRPLGRGRFEASGGKFVILKSSRQPLLDAARIYLAAGVPPDTRITMRHVGVDHDALSSTVGKAARLTVKDTPTEGPVLTTWQPYDSGHSRKGPSPVRSDGCRPSD